ncbi:unnamed protein product [Prorocentrum cordatum]|uniref:Uncharacterized protein n=1 Tax=Prorocentrum cordatum TaxID=2364126 RepID=A0ABN9QLK1_9DINO|nr:unnamed protein product [Polarella glacialis]
MAAVVPSVFDGISRADLDGFISDLESKFGEATVVQRAASFLQAVQAPALAQAKVDLEAAKLEDGAWVTDNLLLLRAAMSAESDASGVSNRGDAAAQSARGGAGEDDANTRALVPENSTPPIVGRLILHPRAPPVGDRTACRKWIENIPPAALRGGLREAAPKPRGAEVQLTFAGATVTAFDEAIKLALQEFGKVQRFSQEESNSIVENDQSLKRSRQAAAAAVGDATGTKELLNRAMNLAGPGGKASKKRRMAQRVVKSFELAQRVASANLREAQVEPESDDEEE